MKARVSFGQAAIILGLLLLQGCVNTPYGWRIPSPMRVPHSPVERWQPPSHAAVTTPPERHHTERSATSRHSETSPPVSPPVHRPTSVDTRSPAPTLTLADANTSPEHVLEILNEASAKLSKITRNKLDGNNAMTYDQAEAFLKQARQAADETNYVAASSLAHKALVLADKLTAP